MSNDSIPKELKHHAKELCRVRGQNPDEKVPVGHDAVWTPRWFLVAQEIRTWQELRVLNIKMRNDGFRPRTDTDCGQAVLNCIQGHYDAIEDRDYMGKMPSQIAHDVGCMLDDIMHEVRSIYGV